jgi:xylan 1,4-beta-xylosidase
MIATCKHYAGYDLEIWYQYVRYGFDAIIGLQDLSEYYLPMFQQCARDSNVGAIMCSYNAINGTPSCTNSYIMQDILRDHWNWTQSNNYISTDCNAVLDVAVNHNYTNGDVAQAAADCYNAGTDVVCEVPPPPPPNGW